MRIYQSWRYRTAGEHPAIMTMHATSADVMATFV
jgi:hypothetical protein